jgi:hypothetical protein
MKSLITIMTIIVLTFAVTAFADDPADMDTRDTGTMLYQESLTRAPVHFEAKIINEEKQVDVGVAMYEQYLAEEKALAESGGRGVAAGGTGAVKEVDENTRIWESIFP